MIDKYIKYITILLMVYMVYAVNTNYIQLQNLKMQNQKSINALENKLKLKTKVLKTIKERYIKRLEFIKNNKVNLDLYKQKINSILADINSISGFNSKIVNTKLSKKYINVALIEVKIKTNFKIFTVKDFGKILKRAFQQIGVVLPFKYSKDKKEAMVGIVILEKRGKQS